MDLNLPEEIQVLREAVRRFTDKELIPLEREYRHDSEGPMPEHLLKPLQEKTKAMGLWMIDVPAEYGGAGLALLPRCIIHEEVARAASGMTRNAAGKTTTKLVVAPHSGAVRACEERFPPGLPRRAVSCASCMAFSTFPYFISFRRSSRLT